MKAQYLLFSTDLLPCRLLQALMLIYWLSQLLELRYQGLSYLSPR
nr:MAG TPA: hypothetical protein [Caudoviricetes sp.]DAK64093.1 MAG TPA: hypothetical protein [Caudoviricetes sp.]DAN09577.1 MAG TPA: hypothetical protein [Caudoviricetes sp.]DAT60722.1 MAG TPA: hypothetical protein [Caudoviricetes sp.]